MKSFWLGRKRILLLISVSMVIAFSCTGHKNESSNDSAIRKEYNSGFAERFLLRQTDSCTVVTISNPWQGAENISQTYYLVRKGSRISLKTDSSKIIYVPVKKIICMSTTHLAMIGALGEKGSVVAVSGTGYVYDPVISKGIHNGTVKDIGYETGLNSELILKIDPDLVMMYGVGSESASYTGKIEEMGVRVMFNADYLETHPLGKAEWIKLFGALYCKEIMADSIFQSVEESYNQLRTVIEQQAGERPNVMLGLPYKDSWYISPGNSYISRLIEDAGGNYLWAGTVSSFSMPVGIEDVFIKSLKADFWLNIGTVTSKDEIISLDPRLGMVPCFKTGNLYNNNKRITVAGGNDYWETGTLHPDMILKDIACILHPDIFRDNELLFYRRIE